MFSALRRGSSGSVVGGTPKKETKKLPILEGPLLCMEFANGGKEVKWLPRHVLVNGDATIQIYNKKGDSKAVRTTTLTGDHFVADAAGFTNGWQVSDFESVLYFACQSLPEKQYWMHAVAGVVRRLMEPMDALPPQYASVAMHRHSPATNKEGATVAAVEVTDDERPPPPPPPTRPPPFKLKGGLPIVPLQDGDESFVPPRVDSASHLVDAISAARDVAVAEAAREAAIARAANEEVATLRDQCRELEESLEIASRERDEAITATASTRQELSGLSAELALDRDKAAMKFDAQSEAEAAYRSTIADLERRLAAAPSAIGDNEDQNAKWSKALSLEQQRCADLCKKIKSLSDENATLKRDLGAASSLKEALANAKAENASIREQFRDAERSRIDELRTAQTEASELRAEAGALRAERDSLVKAAAQPRPVVVADAPEHVRASVEVSPPATTELLNREERRKPPPPPPRPEERPPRGSNDDLESTLVQETANLWSRRAEAIEEEQSLNAFSKHFDPEAAKKRAAIVGDEDYGIPVPGSATDERWQKGKAWVEEQIDALIAVIFEIGLVEADVVTVTFGALFHKYADISDSLVGILMRAKKRNRLYYEGDMLFQNKDDDVIITAPVVDARE